MSAEIKTGLTLNDVITHVMRKGTVSLASLLEYQITLGHTLTVSEVVVDTFAKRIDFTMRNGGTDDSEPKILIVD